MPSIRSSNPVKSGCWLIAAIRVLHSISYVSPSIGTGRRRPELTRIIVTDRGREVGLGQPTEPSTMPIDDEEMNLQASLMLEQDRNEALEADRTHAVPAHWVPL